MLITIRALKKVKFPLIFPSVLQSGDFQRNATQKQLSLKNEKWSLKSINNLTFVSENIKGKFHIYYKQQNNAGTIPRLVIWVLNNSWNSFFYTK